MFSRLFYFAREFKNSKLPYKGRILQICSQAVKLYSANLDTRKNEYHKQIETTKFNSFVSHYKFCRII